MPALDLAWSRIDSRLAAVQRRLYAQLALRLFCQVVALAGVAASFLLLAALLLPAAVFRPLFWTSAACSAAAAVGLAARAWWARGNRLSAARLIDARGGLDERLTTLVSCAPTPASEPLLSMIVAQALAREAQWRPLAMVPTAVPRAAYAAAAAWGLTVCLWLVAPQVHDVAAAVGESAARAGAEPDLPRRPSGGAGMSASAASADTGRGEGRADSRAGSAEGPGAAQPGESMPERLRAAVLAQVAEAGDATVRARSATARSASGLDRQGKQARRAGEDAADGFDPKDDGFEPAAPPPGYAKSIPAAGAPGAAGSGAAAPPAAADAVPAATAASRFRLTLTSFLRAAEQGSVPQSGQDPRAPRPGDVAPNPNQNPDHPLSRAVVPPAYAHVVRDVFSWRPQP